MRVVLELGANTHPKPESYWELTDSELYKLTTYVEINGNNAKFYAGESHCMVLAGLIPEGTLLYESNCRANNLMATILCKQWEKLEFHSMTDWGGKDALWYYWDEWLDKSVGTNVNYFDTGGNGWYEYIMLPNNNVLDLTHSRGLNKQACYKALGEKHFNDIMNWFSQRAAEKQYSVTIYHFSDKPNDGQTLQHVIMWEEHEPQLNELTVTKEWLDGENTDKRSEIEVQLYTVKNGVETPVEGKILKLNQSNNWTGKFEGLPQKDNRNEMIYYTVKELNCPEGYISKVSEQVDGTVGSNSCTYTIINTLLTEVKVSKKWDDGNDADGIRPESIQVTLCDANGVPIGRTATLDESNNWTYTFKDLNKYDANNKEIKYTIKEQTVEGYTSTSTTSQDGNNTTITLTNKHTPEDKYIAITGKVWEDVPDGKSNEINGIFDSNELGLDGIKVILKDKDGKQFDETSTTTTNADGTYTIKLQYNNASKKEFENKLNTAYVEFSYDGLKYTTVKPSLEKNNASKSKEVYSGRESLDNKYSTIIPSSPTLNQVTETDKNIIATTQSVITSFNEYKAIAGNVDGDIIKNVNLGLFKREQPDISIESNISEVEVITNGEKNIYKYNTVVTDETDAEVKAQFQNKQSYTYRRPVNPADIQHLKESTNKDAMSVYVTYEVTLTNESTSLITQVNSIINCYDSRYVLESVTKDGNEVKYSKSNIYGQPENDFSEITLSGLDMKLNHNESSKLLLRYKVTTEAIEGLLNEDATLSNAVEIDSYTTYYGEDTLYAEQGKSGRTNKPYAGYDKDSHPGNAEIKLEEVDYTYTYTDSNGSKQTETYKNVKVLKSTKNLIEDKLSDGTIIKDMPEDDTDIAPSFLLHKEKINIKVKKEWVDEGNKDKRPTSIKVNLKNGETIVNTVTLNDANKWSYTFEKLPRYSIEGEIQYTVEEEPVEGYETQVTGSIAEGYVITNTLVPDKTILSGFVWEDKDAIDNDAERKGNGKYDEGENRVQNVKIELYEIVTEDAGTVKSKKVAEIYSGEDGSYNFEITEKGKTYFMKYTYGDNKEVLDNRVTKIANITIPVNARNYKSTIIADGNPIKTILEKDFATLNESELLWYNNENIAGYSIAVDNMKDRLAIEDLIYNNFHKNEDGTTYIKPENMSAYTKPFLVPQNADKEITTFNFGIIERPRENLVVEKTITYLKVTLANGQVLTEGDPRTQSLAYAKTMGFNQNVLEKQVLIELDAELIQGAELEVQYLVKVTNNNEIDYNYGAEENYTDIEISDNQPEYEYKEYIAKSSFANYYYYGKNEGLNVLDATIELADYLNEGLTYEESTNSWENIEADAIHIENNEQISDETWNDLKYNKYKIFKTSVTLAREQSYEQQFSTTKMLSNNDKNVFDNNVEIIKIDGKTARTIKEVGVEKEYKPGNYLPTSNNVEEQDDDRVRIIITPPTGIVTYIIYIVTAVAGLALIAFGITFIKKKVLIK